ncbi:HU family DNA-binding protein [Laribacter hongkongensis]|uniref:HupB2 n=2 Tax=Laribacter hongkongensis TaxID=168471 RepID=C1D9R2_LARHH|nr:HU family DNA-binding protein [Laribacter hongkongensis]ACO75164.1 HupB2 [Laribacter hongkongensis HLHK9]ASJ25079.1 DNA-binding protein [Laribacter hongkongensis]MBE5530159.1 DNA-binding protein [Laribacter hongkongensis]MCG8992039.1 HU family DNA-binding protein [Laribacter hongkongensis]MCG8996349.1 HU family DNA-binding protein [Laribacter hongkongensis]
MTKQELIQRLAERANVGKVETLLVVDALEQLIREELAAGGEIPLARTGKFRLREQAARMGRNPKTGESVMIPARRKIVFTPAKALKDAVG